MIGSLTTSDLRNTLCGRLKLQTTQKMKITLSQIQSDPNQILVTFAIFAIFADILDPLFVSSFLSLEFR